MMKTLFEFEKILNDIQNVKITFINNLKFIFIFKMHTVFSFCSCSLRFALPSAPSSLSSYDKPKRFLSSLAAFIFSAYSTFSVVSSSSATSDDGHTYQYLSSITLIIHLFIIIVFKVQPKTILYI